MNSNNNETIVFGGGCFWCIEAVFTMLRGVVSVISGYAGGTTPNPTYEDVHSGKTGHAEVVSVEFDPSQITIDDLLTVFFASHDPTTVDRQGHDVGNQYRSLVLYTNDEQQARIQRFIQKLETSGDFSNSIVTEVRRLKTFYPAVASHVRYYENHKDKPYCQLVIAPKISNLQKKFGVLLAR